MRPSSDVGRPGVVDGPDAAIAELCRSIGLVDHHTHSIVRGSVEPASFVLMVTESDRPAAAASTGLDSQVGFAIRRWCAPLVGLEPSISADEYLSARAGMPNEDVARRLLPEAGFERLIVETGYRGDELMSAGDLGALAGTGVATVARLETVAEEVASTRPSAAAFADAVRAALREAADGAVGLKSIVAYRFGLDFDPARPTDDAVAAEAGQWLQSLEPGRRARIADPTLLRFLLWEAVEIGLPLQIHTGFGDPDLDLRRANPLLLTDFLRATEDRAPILLLHTYPFQREAGYLAQMFPHVYVDVGLAVNYVGARAEAVVAESLELAPFGKVLFSSDAWGVPELHLLGSWLFRRATSRVIGRWVADGDWSHADGEAVIRRIASGNAHAVYGKGN